MFDDDEESQLTQKHKISTHIQVLRISLARMKSACVMLKPLTTSSELCTLIALP